MTGTTSPSDVATPDAGSGATRSTVATFSAQLLNFMINFGVAVILARLLSPEDFGLFGIAFAVTGMLEFAKHGGLVVPAIQSETISDEQRNTLFWFNTLLGTALACLVAAAAPLAGALYDDTRVAPMIATLALTFLASGVSAQHIALLRRRMRFTTLAACELSALLIAAAVAVWMALHGARYWALIVFQVGREVLQACLTIATARWRPSWPARHTMATPLIRSGGVLMILELLGLLNFKADNLIVGWRLGPAALGFYTKAYEFLLLPVNQIVNPLSIVVHSSLSRLQRDPAAHRAFLSRALLLATSLGLPLTAFLFANAHTVIVQVLGRQWEPTVPIYRALAPAAACMTITSCVGWIFLSLGRARRQLRWSLLTTVITLIAFVAGTAGGAEGVAVAFSITRTVLLVPTLVFTCAGTFVSWTALLATAARPALGSAVAMTTSLLADALMPVGVWALPRNGVLFLFTYVACWMLMPGGRALVHELVTMVRRRTQHA